MQVGIVETKDFFDKSALMLAKRDIVPSMLDPAFEEEDACSQPPKSRGTMNGGVGKITRSIYQRGGSMVERNNTIDLAHQTGSMRFMAPIVK